MHDTRSSAVPERCSARIQRAAWLMRFGFGRAVLLLAAAAAPVSSLAQDYPTRPIRFIVGFAPGGVMNFASTGFGGATHIAAELLKRVAGIEMTHVPYKGGSLAVIDLIGGHVQMSFGAVSTSLPHLRAGRLRALGVTSAKRLAAIPDVPTFAESGLPGFEVEQWYGVFAPAGLPVAITRKLNAALVPALASPEFKQQLSDQGIELVSSTPEEFAAYVKVQLANWTRMLTETGLRAAPLAR